MQAKFDAKLHRSLAVADAERDGIQAFKKLAKQDPEAVVAKVSESIPLAMRRVRTRVRESYGVDIAREGWKDQFKQKQHSYVQSGLLLMEANSYLVYSRCQTKLDAYTQINLYLTNSGQRKYVGLA